MYEKSLTFLEKNLALKLMDHLCYMFSMHIGNFSSLWRHGRIKHAFPRPAARDLLKSPKQDRTPVLGNILQNHTCLVMQMSGMNIDNVFSIRCISWKKKFLSIEYFLICILDMKISNVKDDSRKISDFEIEIWLKISL